MVLDILRIMNRLPKLLELPFNYLDYTKYLSYLVVDLCDRIVSSHIYCYVFYVDCLDVAIQSRFMESMGSVWQ